MAVKPAARALLERAGVRDALVPAAPANRLRFLLHAGRLEPLPTGLAAAARTPLLSLRGKLRLLAEPFVRRGDAAGESVAEFTGRRLGAEVAERLVGPFLTGVYAGDERQLGAEAVFPSLVGFERSHGSIARGALASARDRSAPRGLPGIHSTRDGLGGLAAGLADGLGEALHLGTRAVGLARDDDAWRVALAGPGGERELRVGRLVLAVPAPQASALLKGVDAEIAEALAGVAYAPLAVVHLGVDPARVRTSIEGFGFLVPRAAGIRLLGCLFMSQLFPGRAPEGRALLTCMLGGARRPELVDVPDAELVAGLVDELDAILGLAILPETLAVVRWPRAVPQPDRHHVARIAEARTRVARLSGLALAGGYVEGVAVADAMASGIRAAEALG
jgi:oxygen-dependent protoporphyrinogen oxidase